jgi:uncharacterized SAM-binding protein YcdF (DUF218 family)
MLLFQKAVALLLMPAGLVWSSLIIASWLIRAKREKYIVGTILIVFTLMGNSWVGFWAIRSLELPFVEIDPMVAREPYDAILVLSGGSSLTPTGSPQLGAAGDRIRLGAALYQAGLARILVASGSGIQGFTSMRELGAETTALWQQLGVPPEVILQLPGPRNTKEEILAYRDLIRTRGWSRVGLVTSAWHLRRALALCKRNGVTVDPLPADFVGDPPTARFLWLVPTIDGLYGTQRAMWEYAGSFIGR